MNIGASEWGIIILIVVILFLGSNRLSGLARHLGQAVGEYDKAREMIQNEKNKFNFGGSNIVSPVPQIKGPIGSEREKLTTIAKALGIKDDGLTEEELRFLISRKIRHL